MDEIMLVVLVSVVTSLITTKIVAIKYMNVIDDYAKNIMDEMRKSVRNATRNK